MKNITEFYTRAQQTLQSAYPTLTVKQQTKIIDRYVKAVTDEVNLRLRSFFLEDEKYAVSTKTITDKSKAQIEGVRTHMHTWFMRNCPLIRIIKKGSNLINELTVIKLNYQVNLLIDMHYMAITNKEPVVTKEVLRDMYSDELFERLIETNWEAGVDVDIVPIDLISLKAFIKRTEKEVLSNTKYNTDTLKNKIKEAKRIYNVAAVLDG